MDNIHAGYPRKERRQHDEVSTCYGEAEQVPRTQLRRATSARSEDPGGNTGAFRTPAFARVTSRL